MLQSHNIFLFSPFFFWTASSVPPRRPRTSLPCFSPRRRRLAWIDPAPFPFYAVNWDSWRRGIVSATLVLPLHFFSPFLPPFQLFLWIFTSLSGQALLTTSMTLGYQSFFGTLRSYLHSFVPLLDHHLQFPVEHHKRKKGLVSRARWHLPMQPEPQLIHQN